MGQGAGTSLPLEPRASPRSGCSREAPTRPPLSALASRLTGRQGTGPAPTHSAWKKLENRGCLDPSPIALADFGQWGQKEKRVGERSAAACVLARVGAHGWHGALLSYVPQRGNLGSSLPASPVTSVGGTEPFPLLLTPSRSISAFSKWSILGPGPSPASPLQLGHQGEAA